MSKGLDALERLYIAGDLELDYVLGGKQKDDYDIVEKELKALEIIKMKLPPSMRSAFLYECDEEEYNLLKEVGL